jgi:hypothetical protein
VNKRPSSKYGIKASDKANNCGKVQQNKKPAQWCGPVSLLGSREYRALLESKATTLRYSDQRRLSGLADKTRSCANRVVMANILLSKSIIIITGTFVNRQFFNNHSVGNNLPTRLPSGLSRQIWS